MTKPILKSVHPTPGRSSHVAGSPASRECMLCIGACPSADQHAASAYTERRQVTWLTFKELAISFSASGSCNAALAHLVLRPAYDLEKRVQASQQHAHHPCRDKGCQVQPASSIQTQRSCLWLQSSLARPQNLCFVGNCAASRYIANVPGVTVQLPRVGDKLVCYIGWELFAWEPVRSRVSATSSQYN